MCAGGEGVESGWKVGFYYSLIYSMLKLCFQRCIIYLIFELLFRSKFCAFTVKSLRKQRYRDKKKFWDQVLLYYLIPECFILITLFP
jgi:hypothetical protein